MRDLRKELSEWTGYPPPWKPTVGEILVGTILGYDQGESTYGPVHTVMVQDEETGQRWSLWLSSHVLLQQFQQHQPQPGERIGLKYEGKDQTKGYHRYRLLVDRPADPPQFSALGGELDEQGYPLAARE